MKRVFIILVVTAAFFAPSVVAQGELETRVYDFGGGNPFAGWTQEDLAEEPFLAPVEEGRVPEKRPVTAERILTTNGMNFGIGSSAVFDPATSELTVTTTAGELELAERWFEKQWKGMSEKSINCIFEMIEVDHDEFSDWLFKNRLDGDDTQLRNEVQKWVKEKRATVLETAQVLGRSGMRVKVEGIEEFIYPTEMDPPEIPNQVALSGNTELPITAQTPTAFETRNLGLSLEADPTLGADDRTVDLSLSPALVKLKGYSEWGPDVKDGFFVVKMPTFYTVRTTTQITVIDGQYTLISTARPMKPSDPERSNALVLNFVRADIAFARKWSRVDQPAK